MSDKSIMWGWEEQSSHSRSKEHREYLIEQYNRNRPPEQHVNTMEELNRALLDNEINNIKDNK
jgi:hypothetical protein